MIYRRHVDPAADDSLAKLARWIAPGATVLELGAATGYFTEHLRAQGCTVDVVEVDPEAASEAARHARRTLVADLDGADWIAQVGGERYAAIVCADVLEHLRDGAGLLRRVVPLLAPGGAVLVSVPNVAHSAIIAGLVDERFEYGGEGLLDPTHLRLYTWRSLQAALHEAGLRVEAWDATMLPPFETEFRVRTEALAPPLRETLEQRPHAQVYQWLARAVVGSGAPAPGPGRVGATATVPVRLLHAPSVPELTLERALVERLPIGMGPTELSWTLPAGTRALRLLLADRSGVVEVHSFALHAGEATLWASNGEDAAYPVGDGVVRVSARLLALVAPDAWIEPAVPAEVIARADRVTATLAWPAGIADHTAYAIFDALAFGLAAERDAARSSHDELARLVHDLEQRTASERENHQRTLSRLEETRFACDRAREALEARDRDFAELEHSVEAYRAEQQRLERAVEAQERIIAYRQSAGWWLELPFVRLRLLWRRVSGR
jgi:2-polyprenyl-3-methyl-5-hydroxy-6-metoxy-1,4-benzoquinol methylase